MRIGNAAFPRALYLTVSTNCDCSILTQEEEEEMQCPRRLGTIRC